MRVLTTVLLAFGLIPALAAAQDPPAPAWPLDSGSRIRILSPVLGDQLQAGTLTWTRGDTVGFRPSRGETQFTIATPNIVRLEAVHGTHQRKAKGALIGLLAGAAVGAVLGAASYKPCEGFCFFDDTRESDAAIAGALGGILGSVLGTLVGAIVPTDTWVGVAVPRN